MLGVITGGPQESLNGMDRWSRKSNEDDKQTENVLEEEALGVRWPRYSMPPGKVFLALLNHQDAERSFVFGFLFCF